MKALVKESPAHARVITPRVSAGIAKSGRQFLALLCTGAMLYGQAPTVSRPTSPVWWRPYMPTTISPARMTNTQRIHSLMRAGKLYLTLQDAIALTVENDLNLEVARTQPINAEWAIERAQAGARLAAWPARRQTSAERQPVWASLAPRRALVSAPAAEARWAATAEAALPRRRSEPPLR